MKKALSLFSVLAIVTMLAMPMVTAAQNTNDPFGLSDVKEESGLAQEDVRVVAGRLIKGALTLLGVVCVIIIIWGGVVWMTAGGNDEKVGTARKILTSGIIGLIIIVAAYAIASFVVNDMIQKAMTGG